MPICQGFQLRCRLYKSRAKAASFQFQLSSFVSVSCSKLWSGLLLSGDLKLISDSINQRSKPFICCLLEEKHITPEERLSLLPKKWGFRKDFSIFVRTNLLLVLYGRLSCLARTLWFQQRVRTRACVFECECGWAARVSVCVGVHLLRWFFQESCRCFCGCRCLHIQQPLSQPVFGQSLLDCSQRPFNLGILTFTN